MVPLSFWFSPCHSERSEESMNYKLFKDILEIDSTSGKERSLAMWLHDHLEAPSKQLMEVGDGTLNLLLTWSGDAAPSVPKTGTGGAKTANFDAPVRNSGTKGAPKVVFCTHMDTVPPYIAPTFPEGIPSRIKQLPAGAVAMPRGNCLPCTRHAKNLKRRGIRISAF